MKKTKLPPELEAYYAETPAITEAENKELGEAIQTLSWDPKFITDEVTENFLNTILAEMRSQGLNQNQLAGRWGKDRQYVSTILNREKPKNFTLKTVVELSMKVGLRVKLDFEPLDTAARTLQYTALNDSTSLRVAEDSVDYKSDA